MTPPMPEYVEYGSLATAPGPLTCTGTRLWAFWVPSDLERVRDLCERVFSKPSDGRVKAMPLPVPYVALTFGEIDRIAAGGAYAERGNVTERQVGVWVPVVVWTRSGPIPVPRWIGAFIPYMWLDNPLSVASGREQYGYPKAWGWATFPGETPRGLDEGEPSRTFTLDVYGLPTHDPSTKAGRHRLLEVTPLDDGERRAAAEEEIPDFGALLADAATLMEPGLGEGRGIVSLPDVPGELRDALKGVNPTVNQFFLKQFRALGDSRSACLQQITRAGARPIVGGGHRLEISRLGPHRIDVAHLDSHPLAAELGVSGSASVANPTYVEMDFTVDTGEVVWP